MTTKPWQGEITELGCLIARGADTAEFLQGQLSADLVDLRPGQLTLAGWHNPQGRVRCLLWVGPLMDGDWRLITETSQLDPLATGLNRYIMRSQVNLAPESAARVMVASNTHDTNAPQTSQWPLPGNEARAIYAGPQPATEPLDAQAGIAELVAAGVPRLDVALGDAFLGQSLNLDILGAISFTKGCFPGQEVLARLHNLGRVKRRLLRFGFEGSPPTVGTNVTNGQAQQRGQVVCNSNSELLASIELREQGKALFLSDSETSLTALPLPYRIPELELESEASDSTPDGTANR